MRGVGGGAFWMEVAVSLEWEMNTYINDILTEKETHNTTFPTFPTGDSKV